MRKIISKALKNERGAATVVEAIIIFPIMILVIVFLIYLGNGVYQLSKVSAAVARYTIDGAAMCTDPYYYDIEGKSSVPSSYSTGIQPYRYMIQSDAGHIEKVKTDMAKKVKNTINSSGYFLGMKPKVSFTEVKYNNHFFYSTFSIEVRYSVVMGVRLFGEKEFRILKSAAYSEVAVNDPADFIRNTNMIVDFIQSTEGGSNVIQKVTDAMNKVKDFLGLGG